jgi:hypothetical protein
VIRGEKVTWVPSFDLNRVILGAQLTAVVALIVSKVVGSKGSGAQSPVWAQASDQERIVK